MSGECYHYFRRQDQYLQECRTIYIIYLPNLILGIGRFLCIGSLPQWLYKDKFMIFGPQRRCRAYIFPRLNFIWSIDPYLKLAPYGIETQGAFDAYSWYIIWIYVDISSCTAVSGPLTVVGYS
jgi:hypothetical protein